MAQEMIALEAETLTPDQIAIRRKPFEETSTVAEAYKYFAGYTASQTHGKVDLGMEVPFEAQRADAFQTRMFAEAEKAELALKEFDFTLSLMSRRHELISAQVAKEEDYVNRKRERLQISSPVAGSFRPLIPEGGFVKQGQIIGYVKSAEDQEVEDSGVLFLRSPKSAFVDEVSFEGTKELAVGDLICILSDDDERRTLERINLADALLSLEAEALLDANVAIKQRLLELDVEVSTSYDSLATSIFDFENNLKTLGVENPDVLPKYKAFMTKASGENRRAELALDAFKVKLDQMKRRHEAVSSQIPLERLYLTAKIEGLHLKMPREGSVTLRVFKGSFVKKGDAIAEIK